MYDNHNLSVDDIDMEKFQESGFDCCPMEITGRGVTALKKTMFGYALCYGVYWQAGAGGGYSQIGMYYYESYAAANKAHLRWYDAGGIGDPPGDWVKHKGGMHGEYGNPNHSSLCKRPFSRENKNDIE